jgi:hypothetical protein
MDVQWRGYQAALGTILAHPETYVIASARDHARMAGIE